MGGIFTALGIKPLFDEELFDEEKEAEAGRAARKAQEVAKRQQLRSIQQGRPRESGGSQDVAGSLLGVDGLTDPVTGTVVAAKSYHASPPKGGSEAHEMFMRGLRMRLG